MLGLRWLVCLVMVALTVPSVESDDKVSDALRVILAVQPPAQGVAEARQAAAGLTDGGAENLLPVLGAFRTASPLSANWLRNVVDTIASRELAAGGKLPEAALTGFIQNTQESPAARRLAYEWLLKQNPQLPQQLIPGMLLDPSPEFRRDAVAMLIAQATAATDQTAGASLFQQALRGAVHKDQVDTIASALRKGGATVNIQKHFGFLAAWQVIGPFDNKEEKGFAVAYPPESELRMDAEYDGQLGKVRWQPLATEDDYGIVDIGKQIKNYKGSVMYATASWNSSRAQELELRLGTPNAWKLWVNGQPVFEREEYHRSTQMDQYRVPVRLQAGSNTILLKICQNEQEQDWAQDYHFQIRICDATGSAVPESPATALRESSQKGAR
jgi:hypothetical protein